MSGGEGVTKKRQIVEQKYVPKRTTSIWLHTQITGISSKDKSMWDQHLMNNLQPKWLFECAVSSFPDYQLSASDRDPEWEDHSEHSGN